MTSKSLYLAVLSKAKATINTTSVLSYFECLLIVNKSGDRGLAEIWLLYLDFADKACHIFKVITESKQICVADRPLAVQLDQYLVKQLHS